MLNSEAYNENRKKYNVLTNNCATKVAKAYNNGSINKMLETMCPNFNTLL